MQIHNCSIIIFHKKNKILLQDRKSISKHNEEWGFFGGHIEKGETPEQALVREIKEELDYPLKEYQLFKRYNLQPSPDIRLDYNVYLAKMPLSKLKPLEGDGMKLFTIAQAKKLKMVRSDDIVLNDFQEYLSKN